MERFERVARIAAYMAIIVVCSIYGYKQLSSPASPAIPKAEKLIGQTLDLRAARQNPPTNALVFSLSTGCPYCKASAPFYQRLVNDVLPKMPNRITTVAFFPQGNSEAESYADRALGVKFDSIQTGNAPGVSATPTLLLVDQAGKVLKAWIGQLAASGEEEVIQAISELR